MGNKHKIALGVLIVLVSLMLIVNVPIIYTGDVSYNCSYSSINQSDLTDCTTQYNYESILQVMYPSINGCMCQNVRTVTVAHAYIQSGTGSTLQNRGTANFTVGFNNPSSPTQISSYNFTSSNGTSIALYSCAAINTCMTVISLTVPSTDTTTYFNATFYLSADIIRGATYNYLCGFINGQSVSGILTAQ